jgi:methylase of polypeptide subunit release factors
MADINPAAVRAARTTARRNRMGDLVVVYQSDNLKDIPAEERWNLIVGNPPHFNADVFVNEIRLYDGDWRLHREFFRDAPRFLAPNGVVVLQENNQGSTAETFRPMVEASGLEIVLVEGCSGSITAQPNYYYVGVMRAGDEPPGWISS